MLDAYLLLRRPDSDGAETERSGARRSPRRRCGRLTRKQFKAWYEALPYGRTSEKLLMIVRAILAHARSRGWIDAGSNRRRSSASRFATRATMTSIRARRSTRSSHAAASEQDAAIYLTAAMTGLRRGELVALRWRDVDFAGQAIRVRANYSFGEFVTPKSGKIRSVSRWCLRSRRR